MLACLNVCWIPSVFLDPLMPKFWKLTLQLLSRYSTWMDELKSKLELREAGGDAKPESEEKTAGSGKITADLTFCFNS